MTMDQLFSKVVVLVLDCPILTVNFIVVEIQIFGALVWHEPTLRPKLWALYLSLIVNKTSNVLSWFNICTLTTFCWLVFPFHRQCAVCSTYDTFYSKAILDRLPPCICTVFNNFNLMEIICRWFKRSRLTWLWAVNKLFIFLFQNMVHQSFHVLLMKLIRVYHPLWFLLLLKIFIVTIGFGSNVLAT